MIALLREFGAKHRYDADVIIKDTTARLKEDVSDVEAYCDRAGAWEQQGEYEKALADYREVVERDSENPEGHLGLAWISATCPDERFRNGTRALERALEAHRLTGGPRLVHDSRSADVVYIDTRSLLTVAAAHAELGNFVEAANFAQEALSFTTQDHRKERVLAFRKRFRAKRPYREAAGAAGPNDAAPAHILADVPEADAPVVLSERSAEEVAFLAAIVADSDSDAPRLAYADWLSSRGDPRGEFIRIDCEMAAMPVQNRRWLELSNRQEELRVAHQETWGSTLAAAGFTVEDGRWPRVGYERGLFHSLKIIEEGLLPDRFEQMFKAAPTLKDLSFEAKVDGKALAQSRYLERIQALSLEAKHIDAEGCRALAASPHLRGLRRLSLSGFAAAVMREFAESRQLAGLRELYLYSLESEAVQGVVKSDRLPGLQELMLFSCKLDKSALHALAASPHLANVLKLDLGCSELTPESFAAMTAPTAPGLLPYMRKLIGLSVFGNELGPDGVSALLKVLSPGKRLETLELGCNAVRAEGAIALAKCPQLTDLKRLALGSNEIDDSGVKALAESPHLTSLAKLELDTNLIGADGAQALASSSRLSSLKELELSGNAIGLAGARALANSHSLAGLLRLRIRTDDVTEEGEALLRARFGDALVGY
jgi:uncharacterized protein (TIGR02996 family)